MPCQNFTGQDLIKLLEKNNICPDQVIPLPAYLDMNSIWQDDEQLMKLLSFSLMCEACRLPEPIIRRMKQVRASRIFEIAGKRVMSMSGEMVVLRR